MKAVTIGINRNGKPWGVRVRTLDEDFVIALNDYTEGDKTEFTWDEACKIGTFTKKQALLVAAYIDEVGRMLESYGGKKLAGYYWTSSEVSANYAFYMYFSVGYLYGGTKSGQRQVRRVVNLREEGES